MSRPRAALKPVNVGGRQYETVAASQTDQAIGATGAFGDHLARLVVTVGTSATSTVSIKDGTGGSSIPIVPANTPVGVVVVELGIDSLAAGGWLVTTGAGATVVAIGDFT